MLVNVIGPESTGKTTLCNQLVDEYNLRLVLEYARSYCQKLDRKPTYLDVLSIGYYQKSEYDILTNSPENFIFDATLITSNIWLYDKFKKVDLYLHQAFLDQKFDITLLCYPDLIWQEDGLREDGLRLLEIYDIYQKYLDHNGKKYYEIRGFGGERLALAKKIINYYI